MEAFPTRSVKSLTLPPAELISLPKYTERNRGHLYWSAGPVYIQAMQPATIDILLGVYNGANYLEETLKSIVAQDFQDWRLWVRDDASTDETPDIFARWKAELGERMVILPNSERKNLGMYGNFTQLLAACTAPYVTVTAHDDLYAPNKLSLTLQAMREREAKCGISRPITVYTDQRVIDGAGRLIAPSLWRLTGWKPPTHHIFGHLLVHSSIYGGTTLFNRAVISLLGTPPHSDDTWLGWIAAIFGELVPLNIATVDFRRHGKNFSELTPMRSSFTAVLTAPWRTSRILHEKLLALHPQVRHFYETHHSRLPLAAKETIEAFLDLDRLNPLARRLAILRYGLLYSSALRNVGLLLLI